MTGLTQARLRELLHYDPETGIFTRLVQRPGPNGHVGAVAGFDNGGGYRSIGVDGTYYKAHRLAFLYMTGEWPPADMDHEGLNRSDNRWAKIRPATRAQNLMNTPRRRDNTSGIKGVSFYRRTRKWKAQIQVAGRKMGLGYFVTKDEAAAAYRAAARRLHGEFARTA